MTLEEQVLTIEQAKHLQELGLDMSDATHVWLYTMQSVFKKGFGVGSEDKWCITTVNDIFGHGFIKQHIETYTLQEVLQCIGDFSLTCSGSIYYVDSIINGKEVRFGACDALTAAYLSLANKLENERKEETR